MPKSRADRTQELDRLIRQQEKDRLRPRVFPENITPRKPAIFPTLTLHQKACFILSFFMKRSEIAELFSIKSSSVSKCQKRTVVKLSPEDRQRYSRIRSVR